VNAQGGIDGHQVDLISEDDAADPATSVAQVHTLVSQDHAIAIVDASNVDSGWAAYVASQKIPVIGQDGDSVYFYTNPDFFPPAQTADSLPLSIAEAAKQVGAKKFGILYCAEASTCQELVAPEKSAAAKAGVDLVYTAAISASAPNYTAQCVAAQQAGATALFIADATSVVTHVAQSCSSQSYHGTLIASDGAVTLSFLTSPGLSNGMIAEEPDIPFSATNVPELKVMRAAFKKYEPAILTNPTYGEEPVESWAAGLLLAAAVRAGGLSASSTPTSHELFTGLYKLKGATLDGITPPLTFKPNKPHQVDCWFLQRTKDGAFTTPYGLGAVCG
jgi:branched-chain amino acid transport system substrate-binding protein